MVHRVGLALADGIPLIHRSLQGSFLDTDHTRQFTERVGLHNTRALLDGLHEVAIGHAGAIVVRPLGGPRAHGVFVGDGIAATGCHDGNIAQRGIHGHS